MEYNNKKFFDETSKFYNSMINSEAAVERKIKLFTKLKIKGLVTADLGCGSGVDSIGLSTLGNEVDAFDPSPKMIGLAEKSSVEKRLDIHFHNFAIEDIPKQFNEKYSFVCSLGNTIANISPNNLLPAFQRIKDILKLEGRALIHILNFDLILSKKERIINITENSEISFVRFYDFFDDHIVFNILKFVKENPKEHELISTKLYPHTFATIFTMLNEVNFSGLEFYSNFNFEIFDITRSKDLIISLTR
ncbi:hypothetical protein MNBD_IGNAVI01-2810 [hydrothermal vent metagenome]|uniref:Methyltransferase domain-containing protein n=1 Tax=hydrothermal vent metagenome TaxID=652676 RepID=A0A3B1CWZ8_9ZZZZ